MYLPGGGGGGGGSGKNPWSRGWGGVVSGRSILGKFPIDFFLTVFF